MGFLDLAGFRTQLDTAMGSRALGNSNYDTWINWAYFDVTGAIDFSQLDLNHSFNTVNGTAAYAVPSDTINIHVVTQPSAAAPYLGWVPKLDFFRRSPGSLGVPKVWTRHEGFVYLHPTPNAAFAMKILGKKEPAKLAASGDLTVIPAMWDVAIFMLSVAYGFMVQGEESRASGWFNRALAYMQSRAIEGEIDFSRLQLRQGGA